jgi:hypothetical protein
MRATIGKQYINRSTDRLRFCVFFLWKNGADVLLCCLRLRALLGREELALESPPLLWRCGMQCRSTKVFSVAEGLGEGRACGAPCC